MSERNEAPFAAGAGAAPAAADGDLSREIERAVAKLPLDRVRCIRIFDDCYRCNWWAPFTPKGLGGSRDRSEINWGMGTSHYVRQSRFLIVTLREGSLTIRERSD